jgi:hypothetical protein
MHRQDVHVVPHGADWATRLEGSLSVTRVFWTKGEAIEMGRLQAARRHVRLIIHRQDGSIEHSDSDIAVAYG